MNTLSLLVVAAGLFRSTLAQESVAAPCMKPCRHVAIQCVQMESAVQIADLAECVMRTMTEERFDNLGGGACRACIAKRLEEISVDDLVNNDPCLDHTKKMCLADDACGWRKDCEGEPSGICVLTINECPADEEAGSGDSEEPYLPAAFVSLEDYESYAKDDPSLKDKAACKQVMGKFKKNKCSVKGSKLKCKKIKNGDYCSRTAGCKFSAKKSKCKGKTITLE